jgi:hypothetical protein
VSIYPVVVDALLNRLGQRPALRLVNLLGYQPVRMEDLRTGSGARECIWVTGATGSEGLESMAAPNQLRFVERLTIPVHVLAQGSARADDAARTRRRCGELVDEVKAVLAAQNAWPEDVTGFDPWDYWQVVPSGVTWINDRLESADGAYAAMERLDLAVEARRTYL